MSRAICSCEIAYFSFFIRRSVFLLLLLLLRVPCSNCKYFRHSSWLFTTKVHRVIVGYRIEKFDTWNLRTLEISDVLCVFPCSVFQLQLVSYEYKPTRFFLPRTTLLLDIVSYRKSPYCTPKYGYLDIQFEIYHCPYVTVDISRYIIGYNIYGISLSVYR